MLFALMSVYPGCASTRKKTPVAEPPPTSANAGTTTIVAIAPPAPAGHDISIPKMLGLPQLAAGVGEVFRRVGSRLLNGLDLTGRFPGLQPQPPLLPLSDPANLEPDAPPAVQAAAEIKAEEDAAPQKIMAIRYLATLGCGGCYEKVEEALLEAMSDCTEEVRFEAVKALQCRPDCGCRYCNSPSCCSLPVRKRLEELTTCEKEPSVRINRVARLALACCNTKPLQPDEVPREGPTPAPAEEPAGTASVLEGGAPNDPVAAFFADIPLVSYQAQAYGLVSQASATGQADRVVAVVNDQPILESQLLAMIETNPRAKKASTVFERQQLCGATLQRLIDLKLLEQLMQADSSMLMPAAAISPELSQTTPAQMQSWLERKLAVDNHVQPVETLAYYQIHQAEYTTPARVRWESLTILDKECKSPELAKQIAAFIKSRTEGMSVVAPQGFAPSMIHSEVMAWQAVGQLPPQLQEVMNSLQPGQISPPFQQGADLCLVRMLARQAAQPIPMSAVAGKINQIIVIERRKVALDRFMSQARAQARIWNALEIAQLPVLAPAAALAPQVDSTKL